MKRYDVLEYHRGDKEYAAGDTRLAEPGSVQHLVDLKILREAEDQANILEPAAPVDPLADLRAQVEGLGADLVAAIGERNAAREEAAAKERALVELGEQHGNAVNEIAKLNGELAAARSEIDALRTAPAPPADAPEGDEEPEQPSRTTRRTKSN